MEGLVSGRSWGRASKDSGDPLAQYINIYIYMPVYSFWIRPKTKLNLSFAISSPSNPVEASWVALGVTFGVHLVLFGVHLAGIDFGEIGNIWEYSFILMLVFFEDFALYGRWEG